MMKKLTVLAAAAAATMTSPASAVPIFNAANGHWYQFIEKGVDFDTAVLEAAAATAMAGYEAHLATVTSAAENNFIKTNVTGQVAWIAGSDAGAEGTWMWIAGPEAGQIFWQNGTTIKFDDFNPGEPNNYLGWNETGLVINWGHEGGWNDSRTIELFGFVIEYTPIAAAVPEPDTWLTMIAGFLAIGSVMRRRPKVSVQFS